jgi:PAS domain S-box-containing protein
MPVYCHLALQSARYTIIAKEGKMGAANIWPLIDSLLLTTCCILSVKLFLMTHPRQIRQSTSKTTSKTTPKISPKTSLHDVDQASLLPTSLPLTLFREAAQHSANSLIICDAQQPDLPIVYVSPSFETLTGYSAAEVIGKNCRFLQGEEDQQIGLSDIRQALATGDRCKVLLRNYRKAGSAFWNEITLSPLVNPAGIITHYVGTQTDISHYLETFKALQDSEIRYRHLYEETPAMLHSLDAQGCIVSVSHYWLEKLGYERQEVISQPLSAFLSADSQPLAQSLLDLPAGVAYRDRPCQLVKKNGDRLDFLLSTIADCQGETCSGSSLGVLVDVTERKQAEEKLRRSEALLRAINNLPPTGIFVMDCHSNESLFVNPEFYRIWQLEHLQTEVMQGQITGEQLLSECLSKINLGAFVSTSTARDFSDGHKIVEDEVPLLDGRTLRRIYGPIQENDSTFAYLYVFEDITERKQAVQKLALATADAEAANRAKSEFLANMSHELRSPLNAILGFTHILRNSDLSAAQKENLDIIYNSGEHLLALINDILDISKIEAGRVVVTESEFDLYRLLDRLQQMFYNAIHEKGLQFIVERSPDLPRMVSSDRLKLRQILINLLSNAVKFTDTGTILLKAEAQLASCRSTEPLTDQSLSDILTFTVSDTGAGIDPSDQARLFEAFVQTQSGLTAHEGTGLGLAISQEYVRLLGGELTVDSAPAAGASFSFSIAVSPVKTPPKPVSADPAPVESHIVGLADGQIAYRILVVDDVALNRKLLNHLLSAAGFEVREATHGEEAIAQWQAWQPHLIWIDMRMPVMGGEEATRRIRALDPTGRTCIVALTASAFDDNRAAALASGCNDFVSKPIQAAEIFDKMAQHLGVRYRYKAASARPSETSKPLTPALLAQTSGAWQHALTQATLDLDDQAILDLVAQLSADQQPLARAIEKHVKNLSYKKLLKVLQEAEAVSP